MLLVFFFFGSAAYRPHPTHTLCGFLLVHIIRGLSRPSPVRLGLYDFMCCCCSSLIYFASCLAECPSSRAHKTSSRSGTRTRTRWTHRAGNCVPAHCHSAASFAFISFIILFVCRLQRHSSAQHRHDGGSSLRLHSQGGQGEAQSGFSSFVFTAFPSCQSALYF